MNFGLLDVSDDESVTLDFTESSNDQSKLSWKSNRSKDKDTWDSSNSD